MEKRTPPGSDTVKTERTLLHRDASGGKFYHFDVLTLCYDRKWALILQFHNLNYNVVWVKYSTLWQNSLMTQQPGKLLGEKQGFRPHQK